MVWMISTSLAIISGSVMQGFVGAKKVSVAYWVVLVLCLEMFINQACHFWDPA
jgi:hypothetical protein